MPCHSSLDGALGAIFRQHAGAAELEEALAGMARDQLGQFEFVLGIEAAGLRGPLLAQQPVGADDPAVVGAGKRCVEHEKMVADRVEPVGVAAVDAPSGSTGAAPSSS